MSSFLDRDGLEYYHSKIKNMIKDAMGIKVNVTQSRGQTLSYRVYGGHNTEFYPDNLTVDDQVEGSWGFYPLSDSFREYISVAVSLTSDEGFNAGTFIISLDDEEPLQGIESGSDEEGDYTIDYYDGSLQTAVRVPRGSTLNISATPATVSTVEYDVTFNYDIPEGFDVIITFNLPNGDTSTYNFTGTGTQTISLPEGTTYNTSMPPISNYSPTPSNGRIQGVVAQDTGITFGYTANEYSYTVSFQYQSGGSAATTYKIYVNNTLVQSSGGSSAVVTGYYGEPFRVEIDPIQGYVASMPTVTGTLGSGSQRTVLFIQSPSNPSPDDPGGYIIE